MSNPIRVPSAAEITPGSGRLVETNGRRIAVFNVGGRYHAIDETCSHEGGPLSEGTLDGRVVTCPWHGARFDVTTGAVLSGPAPRGVATYPVRLAGPDLLVEIPGAASEPLAAEGRPITLSLAGVRPETPDVTSFLFRSEEPLGWQAGQFLRYRLPHAEPDDRGTARYFTIASAPHEGHVMLTTRFAEARSSTFKRALRALPVGAQVEVDEPAGEFTLPDPAAPPVLIAGGIGITPFRAMLVDRDHRGLSVNATLLYAHRSPDVVYRGEIDTLRRRHPRLVVRHVVSPARVTPDVIRGGTPDLAGATFYVSGPEPFVEAVGGMLSGLGVPDTHVKRDYFPGYDWA
jgi:ferredoxin-NADP reductase/nitrite reductase/ring-hydroxylating ferredoxin subunit